MGMTQEQVIVKVDRQLFLVLMEVFDVVSWSRVAVVTQHHELLQEVVRSDILGEWRVEGAQPTRLCLLLEKMTCFLNLLPNDLLDVLHTKNFLSLMRPRVLKVHTATRGE